MQKLTCILLQNTYKKAQPYFLQTTRKPEIILIIFITVLTISFLLSSTSSASFEVNNLDKMILLAVKLSRLDVSNTQLKRGFNFPFKFIYGQLVTRSRIWEMHKKGVKKLAAEKGNLLADHHGNAVSNLFISIFRLKQVVLLFSGISVQWTKVLSSQVLKKSELQRF